MGATFLDQRRSFLPEARHAQTARDVFGGYDAHWLQILVELELPEICWAGDLERVGRFFLLGLGLAVEQLLDAAFKLLELALLRLNLSKIRS